MLFTNPRVRALSDAIGRARTPLPDPDPPLNELEQQGKAVFDARLRAVPRRSRAVDHAAAGRAIPRHLHAVSPSRRHRDARLASRSRPARRRLAPQCADYEITLRPNGTDGPPRTSSDPGRALLTGFVGGPPPPDDWNKLDVPALRGIRKTAPYFHNNSAATLEEVVDHYIEFFKRVKAIRLPASYRRSPRPMACISIGSRGPKSARRCSPTCGNSKPGNVCSAGLQACRRAGKAVLDLSRENIEYSAPP